MITTIFGIIVKEIQEFIKRKYTETRPIQKLIKAVNALWFILAYILPLGIIVFLILEDKAEPTFKNIALFTIICVTLVYNILMSHIISIYKMFIESTKKHTEILNQTGENFDAVYKEIIKLKKQNV